MQKKLFFMVLLTVCTLQCNPYTKPLKYYSGPDLPESEICFLIKPKGVAVMSLNGTMGKKSWRGGHNALVYSDFQAILELKPGEHMLIMALHMEVYNPSSNTKITITSRGNKGWKFTGQAGHIYLIAPDPYEMTDDNWQPYIKDITGSHFAQKEIIPTIRKYKSESKK
jgi:hypothetical protein